MHPLHRGALIIGVIVAIAAAVGNKGGGGVPEPGNILLTPIDPDPSVLVWDNVSSQEYPNFKAGWLKVPLLHDPWTTQYEKSPHLCLRVLMKPARIQPAKLGAILMHCGGPGSDASCALGLDWLEKNSTFLVGDPLSDSYDYWSISQRGVDQRGLDGLGFDKQSTCPFKDEQDNAIPEWPPIRKCRGVDWDDEDEVFKRMDTSSFTIDNNKRKTWNMIEEILDGPEVQTFGNVFFNETYVRWLYRVLALEMNTCYDDPKFQLKTSSRSFNINNYAGTSYLARDIEVFREAIGAKQMSIFGVSYGTQVGSVYATEFPDKTGRLVLDGDMGTDPDVRVFADWSGESTEAVWTGITESCDNSVMQGAPPESACPAGPGVHNKFIKLWKKAETAKEKEIAALWFQASNALYEPGAPCAAQLMKCTADLYATGESADSCMFSAQLAKGSPYCHIEGRAPRLNYPGTSRVPGLKVQALVLGLDLAGRLTEDAVVEWWRKAKETQPIGITRSLMITIAVGVWPAIPRPQPPAGNPSVTPLVIGNLHDGQTPYKNAQHMVAAFPSGRLLTTQFYGHGLQGPSSVEAVVKRYQDELQRGVTPTYDDDVAKFLCLRVALTYLKYGIDSSSDISDYVCKAAGPIQTGPGKPEPVANPDSWLIGFPAGQPTITV